jgi:hypothetical protein
MLKPVTRHLFLPMITLLAVTACAAEPGDAIGPSAAPSNSAESPSTTPTPTTTPSPPPTPSATPSPSPTFPALDVADPSTWLITFQGIGPLVVGDPLATVRQSMDGAFTPADDGGLCASWDVGPAFTSIVPDQGDESAPIAFAAILGGDAAAGENTPRTAAGIGIGSTAADVMAAYPDATEQQNSYGPNLSITDNGGVYIDFPLRDGVVDGAVVIDTPIVPDEYCG